MEATDTTTWGEKKDYPLAEMQCLQYGGHCYEVCNYVLTINPPIHVRICKHCGHKQHGRNQPDMYWHDVEE